MPVAYMLVPAGATAKTFATTASIRRPFTGMEAALDHALNTLGLILTPEPGRYGRYMQLLDDLLDHGGQLADGWTARDIDTALYWTGAPTPTSQQPHKPTSTTGHPGRTASR
ncbi:hypothetical protein AB0O64_37115 [Streptomyces sp. NPDC088341]|uniref:hypothetical protein n=1 Tax=Streptomyces sp. NPDC088341 TaxID=3154870 RepID=UPI0034240172